MSEWWSYHLSDLLLFSPRTYYRLFEIYNAAIWPAQVAAVVLGIVIMVLLRRGASGARGRIIAAILAAGWLFVAIAFHSRRYATINTFGVHCAAAFGVEAGLLLGIGVLRGRLAFDRPSDAAARAGLGFFLFALVLEPLVGPVLGRSWKGIELFGVAPDPTAVATLGLLLLADARRRWMLMVVPVVWCAVTGLTLLAMKSPDFWIAPLVALLAVVLAVRQGRARRRHEG